MRCEPVNICDPQTDGHLVVMHPGQGVHVVLPAVAPTPHLYSDFLVQTGHVTLGDTRVYQYAQWYDLTPWIDINSLHLGEIVVETKKNGVYSPISLILMCQARKTPKKRNKIVTSINPRGTAIKLYHDQVVEMVLTATHEQMPSPRLGVYDHPKADRDTFNGLELLRQETVCLEGGRAVVGPLAASTWNVNALPANPNLPTGFGPPRVPAATHQMHVWLRPRPETLDDFQAMAEKKVDALPLAAVVANVGNKRAALNILLSSRYLTKRKPVAALDPVRLISHNRGLSERFYSPRTGILVNPGQAEGVELLNDENGLLVELAPPCFSETQANPSSRWTADAGQVTHKMGLASLTTQRLKVVPLEPRHINTYTVQRFLVLPTEKLLDGESFRFMGCVEFTAPAGSKTLLRHLNVWMVRTRKIVDDQVEPLRGVPEEYRQPRAEVVGPPVKVPLGMAGQSSRFPKASSYLPSYTHTVQPTYTAVTIEELGGGFKVPGTTGVPFSQYVGKPKDAPALTNNGSGTFKNVSGGSKTGFTFGTYTPKERPVDKKPAAVLNDPQHGNQLTIRPGEMGMVRLPVKWWSTDYDLEFLWVTNTLCLTEQTLFVEANRMVRIDNLVWQEVRVSACPSRCPKERGRHLLGGLRFENQHIQITVPVYLEVTDERPYDFANPTYNQALRELLTLVRAGGEVAGRNLLVVDPDMTATQPVVLRKEDRLSVRLTNAKPILPPQAEPLRWTVDKMPDWLKLLEPKNEGDRMVYDFVPSAVAEKVEGEIKFTTGIAQKVVRVVMK